MQLKSKLQAKEQQMQQLQIALDKSQAEVGWCCFLGEGLPVTPDMLVQTARLMKERETLVRNISCLFKTAQLEIQRKDTELKQLRDR